MSDNAEARLTEDISAFYADPLGYVKYVYPWNKKGTPLENESGPDEWQADVLKDIGYRVRNKLPIQIAIASGHGIGKFQPKSLIIDTPDGKRKWGDLKTGDLVFGKNGKPIKVIAIHENGIKPIYKIIFDDRSWTLAGENHLWNVRGRKERRNKKKEWRTLTTKEIIELGIKRKNGSSITRQWEIPIQEPAQFKERKISIHPYLVGIWLGDGTKSQPAYTKPYPEVVEYIKQIGYEISERRDGKHKRILGVSSLFKGGVFDNNSCHRFIPDEYKFNTIENRIQLLKGLLDSDGEIGSKNSIGYSSTSEKLIHDVIWIVRSLGGKAILQPAIKKPFYYDKNGNKIRGKLCYRITINIPFNPFLIAHKRDRYKLTQERYTKRWIDKIEYSHNEDAMCITVEAEDGLYLTNDFIVTHNSALTSWVISWFISTRPHPQIVTTANTETQLSTKTWRELAKWHKLSIHGHWFTWTATKFYLNTHPETWFAAAIPWNAQRAQAFAGTHEKNVLMLFDESSDIADVIWETAEGAMTTSDSMWFAFGNPMKNTGRFRECWGKFRHRWTTRQIDSRTTKKADKKKTQEWVDDYGEDSDFVRMRVRGIFPRGGSNQFIDTEIIETCLKYKAFDDWKTMPKIMGVDVARYGTAMTVFIMRQGRKAYGLRKFRGIDTMQTADLIAETLLGNDSPDYVMIDGVGIGAGCVDRLRQRGFGKKIVEVQAGSKTTDPLKYYNKRAEMWGLMKDWLIAGAEIPDDPDLIQDLKSIEYGYSGQGQIQLEKKESLARRGLPSPDCADSLSQTFISGVTLRTRKEIWRNYLIQYKLGLRSENHSARAS